MKRTLNRSKKNLIETRDTTQPASVDAPAAKLADLVEERYLVIETYRKNGDPVRTPVWFAEHQGIIYVRTNTDTGKAKRIRLDPHVRIAPSTARGIPKNDWIERSEERRVGKEWRSLCDWSSDVCSSDLLSRNDTSLSKPTGRTETQFELRSGLLNIKESSTLGPIRTQGKQREFGLTHTFELHRLLQEASPRTIGSRDRKSVV